MQYTIDIHGYNETMRLFCPSSQNCLSFMDPNMNLALNHFVVGVIIIGNYLKL